MIKASLAVLGCLLLGFVVFCLVLRRSIPWDGN